ncbi:unnamed protein product [Symbiodinium necroappetens]|uniref:Uncharacterized protein n=1 Tax=Symbiodinium necroappetens TaxID=1628268 RepID=A0A812SUB0_9DINO|nr:unnamed protein product [Symbiodinium necroappetens]
MEPHSQDIYVADSGNNRIRLIFSQIGPGVHHSGYCTNGLACEVTIMGNGLLPGNKLAVIPMEQSCGQPGVMFQMGLAMNPTSEIPSPSFTQKTFNFGPPSVPRTGTYRLCFCVKDAVVFGQITPCNAAEFFIHDAGIVRIVGPDSRIDDAEVVEGMPGRPLALAISGHELSLFDRVRLVNDSQPCGVPGAEVLAEEVQSRDILMGRRYQGNESFSLWVNVTLRASGSFRVCWCQGARIDGTRLRCERGEDFRVEAARVNIRGPIQYVGTIKTGSYEEIAVKGGQLAGFSSSDRIRLVDAATVQCGSMEAQAFSISIENEQLDAVPRPSGAPHRITADSVTWTNVKGSGFLCHLAEVTPYVLPVRDVRECGGGSSQGNPALVAEQSEDAANSGRANTHLANLLKQFDGSGGAAPTTPPSRHTGAAPMTPPASTGLAVVSRGQTMAEMAGRDPYMTSPGAAHFGTTPTPEHGDKDQTKATTKTPSPSKRVVKAKRAPVKQLPQKIRCCPRAEALTGSCKQRRPAGEEPADIDLIWKRRTSSSPLRRALDDWNMNSLCFWKYSFGKAWLPSPS